MTTLQTMRAGVLADVAHLEIREVRRREVGPRDVLVRTRAVGLCGTDFHIYSGQANYHTDERGALIPLSVSPQILGHEIAGEIEEVGCEVFDLQIGDRVVLDQGLNCRSAARTPLCEYCQSGDSHQCEFYGELGITGLPGGLAEYVVIPAVNAIRIESDLENRVAALTEPLGCIVHSFDLMGRAAKRYALRREDTQRRVQSVLIFGAGPAGLIFTQYLRRVLGYDGLLLVSEPNARRRKMAGHYGARGIDPQEVDLIEAVQELTGGRRAECVIDSSGAGEVFRLIPGLLRKQGTLLLYGHGRAGTDLSVLNNVQFLEPTIISPVGASGGFGQDQRPLTYRRALQLLEEARIEVAPWLTHSYQSLDEVPKVFASGDYRAPDYIKGVVTF